MVFLWNVNLAIFKLVQSWVRICTALYGCITVLPIFRHDNPYVAPLSLPTWHVVTRIAFLTSRALQKLTSLDYFSYDTYSRFEAFADRYSTWLIQGMQKTVEEIALNSPSEIDTRAFLWTFDSLDEDHELECFFSGLPSFRSSKVVNDPLPNLSFQRKNQLFKALLGLLSTFSSDSLPELVKNRREQSFARMHLLWQTLQHDFCALWNQFFRKARNDDNRRMAFHVLGLIRNVYITFHYGTDSAPIQFSASTDNWDIVLWEPSFYPLCNILGHHLDLTHPTPHVHGLGVSPSTTIARVVVPDNAMSIPVSLASTPDVPSFPVPAPFYVDENLEDVPMPDRNSSISALFHTTRQVAMESLRIPGTSPEPVAAGTTRGIDIFPGPRTMCLFTPGPLAPTPLPKSPSPTSISPPDAVTVEYTADNRTSSLDIPSSPSPTQALDNILPTGPPLSTDSPATETDHASSLPEHFHCCLLPVLPAQLLSGRILHLILVLLLWEKVVVQQLLCARTSILSNPLQLIVKILWPARICRHCISHRQLTDISYASSNRRSFTAVS